MTRSNAIDYSPDNIRSQLTGNQFTTHEIECIREWMKKSIGSEGADVDTEMDT